jgi:site-specific recombinase XerD
MRTTTPISVEPNILKDPSQTWPVFWDHVRDRLRQANYRTSTLRVYRQVLRNFASFLAQPPAKASSHDVRRFLIRVSSRSPYWLTVNISALRAAFDKVAGLAITGEFRTPKRPDRLPEVLSPGETDRLHAAVHTIRDRLVLGLLSDCGLKTAELCALRWKDIDPQGANLTIIGWTGLARTIAVAEPWRGFLAAGKTAFAADAHVIPGRHPGTPCRGRTIERIVRRAAARADLPKIVTSMTLRHTHAVTCLRAGMSERELQVRLGHTDIETTLLYRRLVPVIVPVSPLNALPVLEPEVAASSVPIFRRFVRAGVRFFQSFISVRSQPIASHPIPSGP